jgi:hypothetical protein
MTCAIVRICKLCCIISFQDVGNLQLQFQVRFPFLLQLLLPFTSELGAASSFQCLQVSRSVSPFTSDLPISLCPPGSYKFCNLVPSILHSIYMFFFKLTDFFYFYHILYSVCNISLFHFVFCLKKKNNSY